MNQSLTPAEALAEIQRTLIEKVDRVPDGWHTAKQLMQAWQVSESTAQRMIDRATAAGIAERRKFRIQVSPDHYYRVTHYRFTPAPADSVSPRHP